MTTAPTIERRGWCPALLTPMASGDGLLARIKPTAARLAAGDARALAEAAVRHGNGLVDLTNRANLQVRGLRPQTVEAFADEILARGLACGDPAVEQIRNVMASPLGAEDPDAVFDSHAAARALEDMLAREARFADLPAKFGFLVDAAGALPLQDATADIAFHAHGEDIFVCLDGAGIAATCASEDLGEAARALALAFLDLAGPCAERPRRMRGLVQAVGPERIFAAAGLTPMRAAPRDTGACLPPHIGYLADIGVFGVGLAFGQIETGALAALADLAERHGDGTLRMTPWRALLLPGVAFRDARTIESAVRKLGLIADEHDPRLGIAACVGKPACASASVETRRDAAMLAASGLAPGLSLHISGCAKGCAHPGRADVTLVGRDGLYDLVRRGRAGDAPVAHSLTVEQVRALLWGQERAAS